MADTPPPLVALGWTERGYIFKYAGKETPPFRRLEFNSGIIRDEHGEVVHDDLEDILIPLGLGKEEMVTLRREILLKDMKQWDATCPRVWVGRHPQAFNRYMDYLDRSVKHDEVLKQIIFLTALSAYSPNPLNTFVRGPSCLSYDEEILIWKEGKIESALAVDAWSYFRDSGFLDLVSYDFRNDVVTVSDATPFSTGRKKVYELVTSIGSVRATIEHTFFVDRENTVEEIPLGKLKVGDMLVTVPQNYLYGGSYKNKLIEYELSDRKETRNKDGFLEERERRGTETEVQGEIKEDENRSNLCKVPEEVQAFSKSSKFKEFLFKKLFVKRHHDGKEPEKQSYETTRSTKEGIGNDKEDVARRLRLCFKNNYGDQGWNEEDATRMVEETTTNIKRNIQENVARPSEERTALVKKWRSYANDEAELYDEGRESYKAVAGRRGYSLCMERPVENQDRNEVPRLHSMQPPHSGSGWIEVASEGNRCREGYGVSEHGLFDHKGNGSRSGEKLFEGRKPDCVGVEGKCVRSSVPILEIRELGFAETFDFYVPIHHNFILKNGVVVHNSIGKTYCVMQSTKFFPKDDVWLLGGLSPTALVHDYSRLMNEQGEEVDAGDVDWKSAESKTLKNVVDMSGKLLIFLEAPNMETFARLRPILSHDAPEIRFSFTDKAKGGGGLQTKNVYIRGFPATIFCTTDPTFQEELATRSVNITPEMSEEKYRDAILLQGAKAAEPWNNHNPDETLVLYRENMEGIARAMRDFDVVIPYGGELAQCYPHTVPRDMRDFGKLTTLIQQYTYFHLYQRPWLRGMDGRSMALATLRDLNQVLKVFSYIAEATRSGIPGNVISFFGEVLLALKAEKDAELEPSGISMDDISRKNIEVYRSARSKSELRRLFLNPIRMVGWIDEDEDPNDRRKLQIRVIGGPESSLAGFEEAFNRLFSASRLERWADGVREIGATVALSGVDVAWDEFSYKYFLEWV